MPGGDLQRSLPRSSTGIRGASHHSRSGERVARGSILRQARLRTAQARPLWVESGRVAKRRVVVASPTCAHLSAKGIRGQMGSRGLPLEFHVFAGPVRIIRELLEWTEKATWVWYRPGAAIRRTDRALATPLHRLAPGAASGYHPMNSRALRAASSPARAAFLKGGHRSCGHSDSSLSQQLA
jgi:hypothetical protein